MSRLERWREVDVQGRVTRGNLFNCLAKCLGRRTPRPKQQSPSTGRCRFGEDDGYSAGESSPNLLFKPIGNHCWPKQQKSENPDSSEPSALTVVQWRSEHWSKSWWLFDLDFPMTFSCNVRWNLFPPRKDSWVHSQPYGTPQKNNLKKVGAGGFLMVTSSPVFVIV